MTILMGIIK